MSDLPPDAAADALLEGLLRCMPREAPPPELRARVLVSMAAAAGARRVVVAAPLDPRPAGWRGRRVPETLAGLAAALAVVAAIPRPTPVDADDGARPGVEAVVTAATSDVERALLLLEARRSRLLASGVGAPAAEHGADGRAPL